MSEFTLNKTKGISGPLLFIIMDGVGIYDGMEQGYPGNAFDLANAHVIKSLIKNAPVSLQLRAHGTAVGMPSDEDMGNSEVGHNAMGAGRVFDQGAKLVAGAIEQETIWKGAWKDLIGTRSQPGLALKNQSSVHFLGLLSDGNVHSHIDHLIAMIQKCYQEGVKKVYVHTLLDGRDVPEQSAGIFLEKLESVLKNLDPEHYAIASGGGRMKITMDRYEADWSMVELGWKTHVKGEGRFFSTAMEAVETYRKETPGIIDQDLPPFVISKNGTPRAPIQDNDIVIFYNFRGDRAIEISRAFTEENFTKFTRDPSVKVHYAGMMEYDGDLHIPPVYLVNPPAIDRTVSEYLVQNQVKQYAISETQKFGHVTYFWNGNNSEKFDKDLEVWKEIPSDRISFDQAPRMKADAITDELIKELKSNAFKFLRVNFANGDMVGHTGVLKAAIEAVETVDQNIKRLLEAAGDIGATVIITADHGNCDQMIEIDKKTNQPKKNKDGTYAQKTSHTLSPVPFIITGKHADEFVSTSVQEAGLGHIASTILTILGFEPPSQYLPSLIKWK